MGKTKSTYKAFKQRVRRWAKKTFPCYGMKSESHGYDFTKTSFYFNLYIDNHFDNIKGYSYSKKKNTFKVIL